MGFRGVGLLGRWVSSVVASSWVAGLVPDLPEGRSVREISLALII